MQDTWRTWIEIEAVTEAPKRLPVGRNRKLGKSCRSFEKPICVGGKKRANKVTNNNYEHGLYLWYVHSVEKRTWSWDGTRSRVKEPRDAANTVFRQEDHKAQHYWKNVGMFTTGLWTSEGALCACSNVLCVRMLSHWEKENTKIVPEILHGSILSIWCLQSRTLLCSLWIKNKYLSIDEDDQKLRNF